MTVTKIGVKEIRALYNKNKTIACITAYDALTAQLVDSCGIDLILVGDSLGMTVLGYKTTIPVTIEESLHHTKAVARGTSRAMIVGDMPFMTYQTSSETAMRNAARYLQEGGADAIKLEGGVKVAPVIEKLTDSGVPVMGHIGLLPQLVLREGGYRVYGRTDEEAAKLLQDAKAVEQAGAFALVIEGVSSATAKKITESVSIPTIGIGAGGECSGQIQVLHDILGLFEEFLPKHSKRYANLSQSIREAVNAYREDVQQGEFPGKEQTFK